MKSLRLNGTEFVWGSRTYVMGIVNVTNDSFSGDGVLEEKDFVRAAVEQGKRFVTEGADMLDVGAESTRPGSEFISEAEELRRVIPVVRALAQEVRVPISIDTYKASVAREAVAAGAHCINDVWGGTKDPLMYATAAALAVPIMLTHNSSAGQQLLSDERLGARFVGAASTDIVAKVASQLTKLANAAKKEGVQHQNIVLDPGLGFGKTVEQNIELIRRLDSLKAIGYPLLIGASRKSFVGYTLDLPPHDRLEGSLAAAILCAERGADIVRVHDVRATYRALRFTNAVLKGVA